jgi:hypothetical protein
LKEVSDCGICKDVSYRILNYDNTTYTGDRFRLDAAGNIKIKTDVPFRGMPLFLESYFRDVPGKPNCSFIASQRTQLNYEVCGTETITVQGGKD